MYFSWVLPTYISKSMSRAISDLPKYIDSEDMSFLRNSRENALNKMMEEVARIDGIRLEKYNSTLDAWKSKNQAYAPCVQAQAEMKKASAFSARVSSIYTLFRSTTNHLGPWIAFIIILITIVLFLSFLSSMTKKNFDNLKNRDKESERISRFKEWLLRIFPPELNPITYTKKLASRLRIKNDVDGIDRKKMQGGRCGSTWIDAGDTCLNTQNPEPYKTGLRENDQDVYMPWLIQGSFYVPQCEDTYTKDEETGKTKLTDKIYYNDYGLTCAYDSKERPKPAATTSTTTDSSANTTSAISANNVGNNSSTNSSTSSLASNNQSNYVVGKFALVSGK
jgi:hypothetical protein